MFEGTCQEQVAVLTKHVVLKYRQLKYECYHQQ